MRKSLRGESASTRSTNSSAKVRLAGELVIVEREPCVARPLRQVLREQLGERFHVLLGRAGRAKSLPHSPAGVRDDLGRRSRKSYGKRSDVGSGGEPRVPPAPSRREPLSGERCLAVPRGCDEHDHGRRRIVEQSRQPRPLDQMLTVPASFPGGIGVGSQLWCTHVRSRRTVQGWRPPGSTRPVPAASRSAAGTGSSYTRPDAMRLKPVDEWILARRRHEGRRDLTSPGHAELLPQDVGVGLRGPRRDAELRGPPPRSSTLRR